MKTFLPKLPASACASAALWLALSTAHAADTARPLDTVLVTAQAERDAIEAEREQTPGAVTAIDVDKLYDRSVTQLADLFRYVPGVWAESYNGNDDVFYSSRGSNLDATDYDKNGVKFLQDGLPVTTADGNNHNRALDPLGARYIVMAHGANALAYGASTLGGAVNFISPTGRTAAPVSLSASLGSFGQWNARATLAGAQGALDGVLTAETQQRDGYRTHSKQDRKNVFANLGVQLSESVNTRFYATYSDYYAELPRELTPAQYRASPWQARPDAIAGNHSKDVQALRLAAKTTATEVAGGTLEVGVSHESQSLYHPIVSLPYFSLLIDTDHKDTGAMLRYQRKSGNHDVVVGANYGHSTVNGGNYQNVGGKPGYLMWKTDSTANSLELFALDRWALAPDWTLVYGTQYVSTDRKADGLQASYDSFSPRIGLIRALGKGTEWFASVSRTYEAPTTFELRDDANGGANPLSAMNGVVIETGLRGATAEGPARWRWELTGYYTALRNEILSIDSPTAPGTSLSKNIDKTVHAGIEALVGGSFAVGDGAARIEPLLSLTVNAFTFDDDSAYRNNRLPSAPRYFARGEVLYRTSGGFSMGPTIDLVGRRQVDFANSYEIGSHALLGARAAYTAGRWEAFAEARNLLDRLYVATVVVKDKASPGLEMLYPGAPRSLQVGVRYRY